MITKKVSVTELRRNFNKYLSEVEKLKVHIIITKYNKPIAVLVPVTDGINAALELAERKNEN